MNRLHDLNNREMSLIVFSGYDLLFAPLQSQHNPKYEIMTKRKETVHVTSNSCLEMMSSQKEIE